MHTNKSAGQGCGGTGSCSCNPDPAVKAPTLHEGLDVGTRAEQLPASVNGVALMTETDSVDPVALRQRACTELLRQAAQRAGLLGQDDDSQLGGVSEAASFAIEQLLDAALPIPAPSEAACRRYYAANSGKYRDGESVQVRHILFAVTPGVDVKGLRLRAEKALLDVRAYDTNECVTDTPDRFAVEARLWSNCPSAVEGGDLGWLTRADCAPEFAAEIFGKDEVGVLPRLVHSRFGLHVVEVLARKPGVVRDFEAVQGAVDASLRAQTFATALRQYLQVLAADADIVGVELDAATSALVQ